MPARSAIVTLAKDYKPADALMGLPDLMMRLWEEMRVHQANQVLPGTGFLATPTTPSAQASGVGNTTWNVNLPDIMVVVDGLQKKIAAAADHSIHGGSFLTGFTSGKSCVARLVVKKDGTSLSVVSVKGTPATTGAEIPCSDEVVTAACGAGKPWVEFAQATLNRTGDATVTEALLDIRPVWGQNVGLSLDL